MAAVPLLDTVAHSENVEDGVHSSIPSSRAVTRAHTQASSPDAPESGTAPEEMVGIIRSTKDHAAATLRTTWRVLSQ